MIKAKLASAKRYRAQLASTTTIYLQRARSTSFASNVRLLKQSPTTPVYPNVTSLQVVIKFLVHNSNPESHTIRSTYIGFVACACARLRDPTMPPQNQWSYGQQDRRHPSHPNRRAQVGDLPPIGNVTAQGVHIRTPVPSEQRMYRSDGHLRRPPLANHQLYDGSRPPPPTGPRSNTPQMRPGMASHQPHPSYPTVLSAIPRHPQPYPQPIHQSQSPMAYSVPSAETIPAPRFVVISVGTDTKTPASIEDPFAVDSQSIPILDLQPLSQLLLERLS